MTGVTSLNLDELKVEVERLTNELNETTKEKLQAAEYGLVVLEEKQQLQQQYDDLESQLDSARSELDQAKHVSNILHVVCSQLVHAMHFSFVFCSVVGIRSEFFFQLLKKKLPSFKDNIFLNTNLKTVS